MQLSKFLSIALPLGLLLSASCTNSESSAAEEVAEVWTSLLDGGTTAGWQSYNKDTVSDGWTVEDGVLSTTGNGGDIVTKDTYQDFELELEWRISAGGNSGIFFNVLDGDGAAYFSGPEMQVLDNSAHNDGKNTLTSAGACYGLYKAASDETKAPGEWNQVRLVSKDRHVQHWLNGVILCEYTIGSDDWNERVAASKFNQWERFGTALSGRIGLQGHGNPVAFRNLRIREL